MREIITKNGERRFKRNRIVRMLLDGIQMDMNKIWQLYESNIFTKEEIQEFYQIIGYSIQGYNDIFGENIK